jgi:hypothetical protein
MTGNRARVVEEERPMAAETHAETQEHDLITVVA